MRQWYQSSDLVKSFRIGREDTSSESQNDLDKRQGNRHKCSRVFSLCSLGGLHTITSPNGPWMRRIKNESPNGRPLVSKPYTKQVEDLPVLTAREAEVESTRQLTQADLLVAMQQAH